MFESNVQEPSAFIETLRLYHEAPADERGQLANKISELIVGKRVDLAAVRQELMEAGERDLADTLNQLVDLIEPYIEEGGVEE